MTHLRSAGTSTSVAWSKGELERILERYGCTRSGHETDREAQRLSVWFTVPDHKQGGGEFIPVRLEVQLRDVRARLVATARSRRASQTVDDAQVERVAWRHIVFLVEAGLVAADAGIKPVSEFFLADTLVHDATTGETVRFLRVLQEREPRWKALLQPGPTGSVP